ncbi:MAG TPA: molybdenum cofactor guanylyltransferase [Acidimicrobiales bacterium]
MASDPAAARATGFAAAILTGGRSSRMGRDKALIEVDGVPMVLRVAAALERAGAEPVLAVGGDSAALTALGLRCVPDRHPGQGPLGGLLTAFAALDGHQLVAAAATDLPWLTPQVVGALVDAIGPHAAALARTSSVEPLCGVWRVAAAAPALTEAFAGGERAVHRAVADLDVVVVEVPPEALRNVNEPEDLGR